MVSPEKNNNVEQLTNAPGVGALLKASRLRIGDDLRDISNVLRIRHVFLEAIEDGRFDDLPGETYAKGFIRVYAEHLGLDSDEVVRRYKIEVSDESLQSDLNFPEPISEPGIPGGAIVFVGIVVAAVAYGAWYANTLKDGFLVEMISPVPDRLARLSFGNEKAPEEAKEEVPKPEEAKEETPEATEAKEETPETVPPPETAPEPPREPTPETASESPGETETAGQPAAESSASESQPETAPESTPEPTPEPTPAPESAATPEPSGESTPEPTPERASETAQEPPREPTPETASETAAVPRDVIPEAPPPVETPVEIYPPEPAPAETAVAAAPAETSPVPETPAAVPAPAPAAPAQTPAQAQQPKPPQETPAETAQTPETASLTPAGAGEGSIVIRAKSNSWIQVRDENAGKLLVTRLLRAGDSYSVPKRPGLQLSTGNAGALEILVDGEPVPSIGSTGTVRRKVDLDPEKLKAGTAVSE